MQFSQRSGWRIAFLFPGPIMKISILSGLGAAILSGFSAHAATFTITNANATGIGSLQQAILDANANAGSDHIVFNITTGGLTISPGSALPTITDPVIINGATEPGYVATPLIELNGTGAGAAADGLRIATLARYRHQRE